MRKKRHLGVEERESMWARGTGGKGRVRGEETFVIVVGVGERGFKTGIDGFKVFLRQRIAFTHE